jgi:hypothetical protein
MTEKHDMCSLATEGIFQVFLYRVVNGFCLVKHADLSLSQKQLDPFMLDAL